MMYKENPKTKGSGIICCIPQTGRCPNKCPDCFFQSGRSYLEPLEENLPNMPLRELAEHRVVRVNDGNDSNVDRNTVVSNTLIYPMRFYNTAMKPNDLEAFPGPVVLTVNPGELTDKFFYKVNPVPKNLMMVRVRVNTWNLGLVDEVITYYALKEVPVILTFMAYYGEDSIPAGEADFAFVRRDLGDLITNEHRNMYIYRKRTLNPYWAIRTDAWEAIMDRYRRNKWVYSCGKIEGELGTTACRHCGNCLREFFATRERMRL